MDIANNDMAPAADRTMAKILAHMKHKASADDKAELKNLK
jgi:hypothetical protein